MTKNINRNDLIAEGALPRVLIIGQTFTTDTGGGITLSNLFKNWPKNKLAIAVESKESVDFDKADYYYRIGYNELKMPFPFAAFQRKTKSGMISRRLAVGATRVKETSKLKTKVKSWFDNVLHYSGLFFWMYGNQKITPELVTWVEDFKPDLIYYQPSAFKSIDFVLSLQAQIAVPMITHVMDDWFSFAVRPGPFKTYWQAQLDKKVKRLFSQTRLHLSICGYMSFEYKKRYGYDFLPFHNSVDLSFWSSAAGTKKSLNKQVHILYAGRVGYGLEHILLKTADVIERMGEKGILVSFELQTKEQQHKLVKILAGYKHVFTSEPLPYTMLPEKFAKADILLIPCDFKGAGLKFIRYSMPTKVSEYMATGTPVLVIGPEDTALVDYAKEGWAKVCFSEQDDALEAAINQLIQSAELRQQVTAIASEMVTQNHDENKIISQFRQCLVALSQQVKLNHLHV